MKKLFVLLLVAVLLVSAIPALAAGGGWHWGGPGSGGHSSHVCNISCPNGHLDVDRCVCVPPAPLPGAD